MGVNEVDVDATGDHQRPPPGISRGVAIKSGISRVVSHHSGFGRAIWVSKPTSCRVGRRHTPMTDDTLPPFALPSLQRKKLTAAFDGGRISSHGGVMLLGLAERRIGVAEKLAAEIAGPLDPTCVVRSLADIPRARIHRHLTPGLRATRVAGVGHDETLSNFVAFDGHEYREVTVPVL